MATSRVLAADLAAFSASDALHWASTSSLTGRLRFSQESHRIDLVFEGGSLVNAASSEVIESFGRHLYSERLVDEVDLAAAVVHSRDNQALMGRSMIALGVVDPEVLEQSLHDHTVNLAQLPLEWTSGRVTADAFELGDHPRLQSDPVDVNHLMIEAARREDELNRVREYMPTDDRALGLGLFDLAANSPGRERRILEKFEPGATIHSLYEQIGGSYHHLVWTIKELLKASVLEVLDSPDAPPAADAAADDAEPD